MYITAPDQLMLGNRVIERGPVSCICASDSMPVGSGPLEVLLAVCTAKPCASAAILVHAHLANAQQPSSLMALLGNPVLWLVFASAPLVWRLVGRAVYRQLLRSTTIMEDTQLLGHQRGQPPFAGCAIVAGGRCVQPKIS
jgi:hypothetical protein